MGRAAWRWALLLGGLGLWGGLLDRGQALSQPALFLGLQGASLAGAGLGLRLRWPGRGSRARRLAFAVAGLLAWRISYFPVLVFSGHLASIGEWLLLGAGLPAVVYPTFLMAAALLHAGAALAASFLVAPPFALLRWALIPPFLVAALISFGEASDLTLLPDRNLTLSEPVPPPRPARRNPYRRVLGASGYTPGQRLLLLAASLTYRTIPPSPWASSVKGVLEGLFEERPHASTAERVREHYRAYHSAQSRIRAGRPARHPPVPAA